MKSLFAFLILSSSMVLDIDKTATINRLKKNAEIAYQNGYFHSAAQKYDSLIKVFEVKEPQVYLNLAHCYYQLRDSANSHRYYRYVADSVPNPNMRTVAFQQLGNLETPTRTVANYQKAVNHFKNALRIQPQNQEARHNYEVARKILDQLLQQRQREQSGEGEGKKEEENSSKQPDKKPNEGNQEQNKRNEESGKTKTSEEQKKKENPKPNQENQETRNGDPKKDDTEGDSENAEKKEQDGDMNNAKPTNEKGKENEKEIEANALLSQRLKNMNLTPESAQMLLDAMKNSEIQYLQQNSRKPKRGAKKHAKDW